VSIFRRGPEQDVCDVCGVYFLPVKTERRWLHLCQPHRKEREAIDRRKDLVLAYAERHWEELEPEAIKEADKNKSNMQQALAGLYNMQQAGAPLSSMGNVLFGWPGA